MLILFSAIIVILIYFLYQANENKAVEKDIHNNEIKKLNELKSNSILNQNYTKAETICKKIELLYNGSNIQNEKQFKYKITRSQFYQINAQGYIDNGKFLKTVWNFNRDNNTLKLFISFNDNINNLIDIEKSFKFDNNIDDKLIIKKIIKFISKRKPIHEE